MIKIGFKKPKKNLDILEIENSLRPINELLNGYFEVIPIKFTSKIENCIMLVNEDGHSLGLPANINIKEVGTIVGNIIFTKSDEEGEFVSLSDEELKIISDYFNKC